MNHSLLDQLPWARGSGVSRSLDILGLLLEACSSSSETARKTQPLSDRLSIRRTPRRLCSTHALFLIRDEPQASQRSASPKLNPKIVVGFRNLELTALTFFVVPRDQELRCLLPTTSRKQLQTRNNAIHSLDRGHSWPLPRCGPRYLLTHHSPDGPTKL
jgi:hypothetical protein